MITQESISNLELMSTQLDKAAQTQNDTFAHYLEQMSFEMQKHAQNLREIKYILDI